MIYFDNSATTFPKPRSVALAVSEAVRSIGGNPGRGGHAMSVSAAEAVYKVREQAARLFGADSSNVAFTSNCTHALNMAIKGTAPTRGRYHIIISSLEHNSSSRPVYALTRSGAYCSIAQVSEDDAKTLEAFKRLIRPDTAMVVCTAASNVTGKLLPIREIAGLCRDHGICMICDAAQTAGIYDMKVGECGNIICTAGHKGLYGPAGTGLLISDGSFKITPIIQGGTGTASLELEQPDISPESLESGTVNTSGIIGLGKGIEFVAKTGTDIIRRHEEELCGILLKRLRGMDRAVILRGEGSYAPIVAFNIGALHSTDVTEYLSGKGFALRGGYHCAAIAHRFLGTTEQGAVRFSPSAFSSKAQTEALAANIAVLSRTEGLSE